MLNPGTGAGRAFTPFSPQKKISQNCSACAPQFSQIIYAALFPPPPFAHCKINPQNLGQKSTATQKVKHGIYRKRQNRNLARRPSGQGAGQEGLILTPFPPCQSIYKRHTNSGASAAHVLPIIQK
jgi:hypothetical protein